MDTLRLMLLSLLIGATVSTSPTYTDDGFALNQTIVFGQQVTAQPVEQPTPLVIYLTASPAPATVPPATAKPTAKPTSTSKTISTGTSITRELYRGCQGDDVRKLQQMLKNLGYSVGVDGTFGTQTRNAVITFQKNNGLKADGIAGARTIRRLASGSAVPANGGDRTNLSYGMSGQDVLQLQYRLAELGYYYDACSGNYLGNTRDAVRWFQQVNGLSVDGIAGPMTLTRIYSSAAIAAPDMPGPIYPTPSQSPTGFYRTLYQGMSGQDVVYLQQLLKKLGYLSGDTTGFYGSATYWAVSTFQAFNGLYADGVAGSSTQQRLLSGNAVPYPGGPTPTPTPIPTPTPTPTLEPIVTEEPGEGGGDPEGFSIFSVGFLSRSALLL